MVEGHQHEYQQTDGLFLESLGKDGAQHDDECGELHQAGEQIQRGDGLLLAGAGQDDWHTQHCR
jgi:hypothetical protein